MLEDRRVVLCGHILVHGEVCELRIGAKSLKGDDENDEGQDHGKTGAQHSVAVLFVQFGHLLLIHRLVVRVLLLQLFKLGLHLLHDQVLLAHLDTLINIEGQGDCFEHEGKHDDAYADDSHPFDDDFCKLSQRVKPDPVSLFEEIEPDVIKYCHLFSFQTSHFFLQRSSGAGSYPPLERGLHRNIRQIPRSIPAITPRLLIQRFVYSEQVGV